MKKKCLVGVLSACLIFASILGGCSGKEEENTTAPISLDAPSQNDTIDEVSDDEVSIDPGVDKSQYYVTATPAPEGKAYSELTGLLIDEDIKNQRPLAIMVDNEKTALAHYGLNDCDIVYEMVNSTLNDHITRLMCIIKDWEGIERLGSVRSTRVTNCYLAGEYNAILCHDGGPYYINEYVNKKEIDHLSGVFSRISNGKPREFTEYVTGSDLQKYIINSDSISREYNEFYTEDHFNFAPKKAMELNDYTSERTASDKIELPYKHNGSKLFYNSDTNKYEYYEYGDYHKDAVTNEVLTFDNVIIQKAHMGVYDEHGYMVFDIVYNNGVGYYIADGKCVDITWEREGLIDNTIFKDASGEPVVLNAGKTYIAIVPEDDWDDVVIQ